jgi:hypothetical protein
MSLQPNFSKKEDIAVAMVVSIVHIQKKWINKIGSLTNIVESCRWSNTLQGQLPDFQAPPYEVFVHLTSFFTTFVKEP